MPVPIIIGAAGGVLLGVGRVGLMVGGRGLLAGGRSVANLRGAGGPLSRYTGDRALNRGLSGWGGMDVDVRVRGLADTRRAFRRVGIETDRAIERELRDLAKDVSAKARARAPVLTGKLQRSIRPSVTVRRGAAVVSNLPYSKVHEWGGTISPRGVPIEIKPSRMIAGAVESSSGDIDRAVNRIGDAIERAWVR